MLFLTSLKLSEGYNERLTIYHMWTEMYNCLNCSQPVKNFWKLLNSIVQRAVQLVVGKGILGSRDVNLFLIFTVICLCFSILEKNTSRLSNHEINLKD